jgi:putative PIG3 family NAD(P)H quinone oxidoreductase
VNAVTMTGPGGADVLGWGNMPDPQPGPGEVLVEVAASAVNRADLLQRMGFYPPPPGASDVLGLECSGRVAALGPAVQGWRVGDEVCALLAGGGYAELVAVPAGQLLPVPAGVDVVTAAALPEAACTVWSNLVLTAGLAAGESVLVHGGASGIGTIATQVAAALDAAPVICTVGSAAKAAAVAHLGATHVVDYHEQDFVAAVHEITGRGVDVVLDIIGASYLARNLDVLAPDGRLVVIGLQGGATAEIDLGRLMVNRQSVHAATLRARPIEQKAAICRAVVEGLWPLVEAGRVRPVVHTSYPMTEVAKAHQLVEESAHVGKVLLVRPE